MEKGLTSSILESEKSAVNATAVATLRESVRRRKRGSGLTLSSSYIRAANFLIVCLVTGLTNSNVQENSRKRAPGNKQVERRSCQTTHYLVVLREPRPLESKLESTNLSAEDAKKKTLDLKLTTPEEREREADLTQEKTIAVLLDSKAEVARIGEEEDVVADTTRTNATTTDLEKGFTLSETRNRTAEINFLSFQFSSIPRIQIANIYSSLTVIWTNYSIINTNKNF